MKSYLAEKDTTYHFNHAFIKSPKSFGNVRLFQIGDMVCNHQKHIPTHKQICFEITCVLDGEIISSSNNVAFRLKKNMIHFSLPNEQHELYASTQQGARFFFLGFDVLSNHILYDALENFIKHRETIQRVIANNHAIFDAITKCLQEISAFNNYSSLLIESYLNEIIVLMVKSLDNSQTEKYRIKDKELLFSNIISYIDANILDITSVHDICSHFSFSESYLSHIFTSQLGISLFHYYNNVRFDKALKMLNEGSNVTEVAEKLNYTSIYTFSRAFRNKFGVSPTHYQKKLSIPSEKQKI